MKKFLSILFPFLFLALMSCNSDEQDFDDSKGQLVVNLQLIGEDDVDFSEYSVAIIPKQGFIASAPIKDIEWPVEVYVGVYTIAAASPKVLETETTESYYYGEIEGVRILKDQTTEVTVLLNLVEYPKTDI